MKRKLRTVVGFGMLLSLSPETASPAEASVIAGDCMFIQNFEKL